jgi:hypothetical protein
MKELEKQKSLLRILVSEIAKGNLSKLLKIKEPKK